MKLHGDRAHAWLRNLENVLRQIPFFVPLQLQKKQKLLLNQKLMQLMALLIQNLHHLNLLHRRTYVMKKVY